MSEWISVKDERPKVQRGSMYYGRADVYGGSFLPVLFATKGKEVCAGRFFGTRHGYYSLQGVQYPIRQITHWQPMPLHPASE